MTSPKRIGFLSFGALHPGGGLTQTGGDALRQTAAPAPARHRQKKTHATGTLAERWG
jgi:hypothetical protein